MANDVVICTCNSLLLAGKSSLRLIGPRVGQGRVEMLHYGIWASVCDDGWDISEAKVVCRALGFPGAIFALEGVKVENGHGPIWFKNLQCWGNESSLHACVNPGLGNHNCFHSEDAGVVCMQGMTRL